MWLLLPAATRTAPTPPTCSAAPSAATARSARKPSATSPTSPTPSSTSSAAPCAAKPSYPPPSPSRSCAPAPTATSPPSSALYDALDWLLTRQARLEQALAQRHLAGSTLLLYDVSSSYLTGRHCPLGRIGYSRDGKRGNTADPTTMRDVIAKVRRRFSLQRVVLVGDRGMLTTARIEEELRPVEGLDWISALRNDAVRQLAADDSPLQLSLFDRRDLAEISHPDFPGERLLACLNPLLQATERELGKVVATTRTRCVGRTRSACEPAAC